MSSADPRLLQERAADVLAGVIATVRPEQLGHPTPCDGMEVRALLAHVVQSTIGLAQVAEGSGTALGEVPDDGWPAAYRHARERFAAAWADNTRFEAPYVVPWGSVPGSGVVAGAVMETAAHAWDLAQAVGVHTLPDQELAEATLELTRPMVGADRRGEGVPFGPVQEAPSGADGYGRLAAWLGRRHDWAIART
jgi:uncharacterized protein (TIGR03086 family)